MTKLEKIERDIEALGPDELSKFREWFAEFDSDNWDRQIEAYAESGKFDKLAASALAAHRAGRTKEL
jgi:hypothetical protein